MKRKPDEPSTGCGCCRRDFLGAVGLAAGGAALQWTAMAADEPGDGPAVPKDQQKATVRVAFIYTPSEGLRGKWWSWPGNDFDAEARQKLYTARLKEIETRLGIRLVLGEKPIYQKRDLEAFCAEVKASRPDALMLIPMHHPTFALVDRIIEAVGETVPTVIFSCLGSKHGPVKQYRRPGVHLIQSLDNFPAMEYALRMIHTRRVMRQSRVLSVAGSQRKQTRVPFWGTEVRVVPIQQFVDEVGRTPITDEVKRLARRFVAQAKQKLEPSDASILTAARVHFAIRRMLQVEQSDAITMDCLRRGEYQPCMSFMTLRDEGIAAGCENDLYPTLTLMLLSQLFDRPGFQHNPAFETEANHYFASHCTSATKLSGREGPRAEHLLRSFAHTNDPTCVPQILWPAGQPVTMARLLPGKEPGVTVYTGEVVKSYAMPPVGGCRTNVQITINELDDACDVEGHHNVLILGDFGRRLRQFARLYGIGVEPA